MNDGLRECIKAHIESSIEDFEERIGLAYSVMNKMRYPLSIADYQLSNEIEDKIQEYCEEYDIPNFYSVEDFY